MQNRRTEPRAPELSLIGMYCRKPWTCDCLPACLCGERRDAPACLAGDEAAAPLIHALRRMTDLLFRCAGLNLDQPGGTP